MVDLFVCLIINGRRTFDKVPTGLRDAVKEELAGMALGTDGKLIQATTVQ